MGKKIKFQILRNLVYDVYIDTDDYKYSPHEGVPPEVNWDDTPRVSWRTVAHEAWERGVPWTDPVGYDWELLEWDEISDEEYERRK